MDKIKKQASKIGQFFRVTDDNGLISLTNITMILVMYKIAVAPVTSITELTALAIGVIGYQVKRAVVK